MFRENLPEDPLEEGEVISPNVLPVPDEVVVGGGTTTVILPPIVVVWVP